VKAPCADIQRDAVGLTSLRADDPERVAALAHAETCAACAAALAEGGTVLAALDVALSAEAPRSDALARARQLVLDEARRAPRPAAGASAAHTPVTRARPVVVASLAGALLAEWTLLTAKHWASGPGLVMSISLALAAAAISVGALHFAGDVVALAVPVLALGSAVLGGGNAGTQAAIGVRCAFDVAAGTALLAVPVAVLARRGLVPRPATVVPAVGAAAALNLQAALQLGCRAEPGIVHPLLFHALPVILVGGACFVVARRIFAPRPPSAVSSS
jgi:hypothetical protein